MLYFLIPVYNEADNIASLFRQLQSVVPEQERIIVFSDDGSADDSVGQIEIHFKNVPHQILGDGINRGPGAAFNAGFEWILQHSKNDTDVVVTIEADSTSDISLLPKMLAIHQLGYDLVLASVYAQGGGFDGTTFFRKLISSVANLIFRFVFDVKVLTLSSFYRVYNINLLRNIKTSHGTIISERGFICMLELLVKAIQAQATIIEVPTTLHSTKRLGKSKMKIMRTTWDYLKFFTRRRDYKGNSG